MLMYVNGNEQSQQSRIITQLLLDNPRRNHSLSLSHTNTPHRRFFPTSLHQTCSASPGDDWPLTETPSIIKSPDQPDCHRGINGGCESRYEQTMWLSGEEAGLMFRPLDLSFISFHSASTRPCSPRWRGARPSLPFTQQHVVQGRRSIK